MTESEGIMLTTNNEIDDIFICGVSLSLLLAKLVCLHSYCGKIQKAQNKSLFYRIKRFFGFYSKNEIDPWFVLELIPTELIEKLKFIQDSKK